MDILGMMKKAQELQARLQESQESLAQRNFEGQAGGGAVRVTLSGAGHLLAISLNPSILDPAEKEMTEDLILAAFADAKGKADQAKADEMQSLTAGLPIPPGMKLPF